MPISREQFAKGLSQEQARIVAFLEARPDQAFTLDELLTGASLQPPLDRIERVFWDLQQTLVVSELVQRGLVDVKTMGGKTYYAVKTKAVSQGRP